MPSADSALNPNQATGQQSDAPTHTRLTGPPHIIAMVATATFTLAIVGLFIIVLPAQCKAFLEAAVASEALLSEIQLRPVDITVYYTALIILLALVFAGTAALIFLSRPDDRMALLTTAALVGIVLLENTDAIRQWAAPHPARALLYWSLESLSRIVVVFFVFSFPTGRIDEPKWLRWAVLPAALLMGFRGISAGLLGGPEEMWLLYELAVYVGALAMQYYRAKHILTPTQRQQTKWMLNGFGITVAGWTLVKFPPLVFSGLTDMQTLPGLIYNALSSLGLVVTLSVIPVTLAFSILRFRLWEVDFFINRSLIYGGLTIILGTIFVGTVVISQWLFRLVTGQGSPFAIAISTVVITVTAQHIYRYVQRVINRYVPGFRIRLISPREAISTDRALVGQTLGIYEVGEPIGRGGMADVYRGRHPTLNRDVAIKVLSEHLVHEADFRRRFEREAQAIAALRHPNIVQIFDFGEQDGIYFMVMEYIDGPSLAEYLKQTGAMPLEMALPPISDVADALDYAHARGLVHRDVKPSNVMLQHVTTPEPNRYEHRAILTDFGIARIVDSETRLTRTGMIGTFDYIAPEQIEAAAEVDWRADIYALGIMTFEMLTGKLPFGSGHPGALVLAHLTAPPPDPRDFVPDLSPATSEAIRRVMAKRPEDRFATGREFVEALR